VSHYSYDLTRHNSFFFQAEGGIRGFHVTGVQTCALPIWPGRDGAGRRTPGGPHPGRADPSADQWKWDEPGSTSPGISAWTTSPRSEERRVGKERRGRAWRYQDSERSSL